MSLRNTRGLKLKALEPCHTDDMWISTKKVRDRGMSFGRLISILFSSPFTLRMVYGWRGLFIRLCDDHLNI